MIEDATLHIAVLRISIHIPSAQSLKEKRMVLKSLKDRVRVKFNVSMAEVDGQDKWQVSTLAFAMIGSDNRHIDRSLQNLLSFMDEFPTFEVCDHEFEFI